MKLTRLLFTVIFTITVLIHTAHAISANSAVVIDADTHEILFEHNANEVLPMASTTKIMTAIVAIENFDLSKEYEVKKEYTLVEGSSMYLKEGEAITLLDTLYGLMLQSGNDAALAIAGECGGHDEFVELMNKTAQDIGLINTHFENPNGLDGETHHTTANELALLTAYAMENDIFREIVATKNYNVDDRSMTNHNKMLWNYEYAIGVKTGYTMKSGRCLVSAAQKNDRTLICVTLNAPDDWNDHETMLDDAFSQYDNVVIASKGDVIRTQSIQSGVFRYVDVVLDNDIEIYGTENDINNINKTIFGKQIVYAPVKQNDVYGSIEYTVGDTILADSTLSFVRSSELVEMKKSIIEEIKSFFFL